MQIHATSSNPTPALLISSAAAKAPLLAAVRQASQRLETPLKVIAGDSNPQAISRYLADDFWCMPATHDEYFITLLEGCRHRNIKLILPTRDGELLFWARHASQLQQEGIQVLASSFQAIQRCLDKLDFSQYGQQHGLPFIPSFLAPIPEYSASWVVKERHGAGSRSIGINLPLDAALEHAEQLDAPIFQPWVQGEEISIDAWLDRQHQVKGLVLRRREQIMNGESQVTTTFHDADIETQATALLESLELSGHVIMQAFLDQDHQLQIIECNPRFGGASTASLAVGLDSLYWSMQEALGQDITGYVFNRKPDITQVRVTHDLHFQVR